MAKVCVKLPVGVTYPEPQQELECEGETVGEALSAAIGAEPRLEPRVYRDGRLYVGVFINNRLFSSDDPYGGPGSLRQPKVASGAS